jgi:hypothetical protein
MSDVFISYAREDQALARALAEHLKVQGFDVWLDVELLGSDDFYEVILAALSNARAAIVIWTKTSVSSRFVRDEARFALHQKKLIATKVPELDVYQIPFGFQGQHTELVSNRDQIVRAIEKLGVRSSRSSTSRIGKNEEATAWERVRAAHDPDELLGFIDRYPTSTHRAMAIQRVRALLSEETSATRRKTPGLFMNNPRAFLSGLTFRVPNFQLSTPGLFSSIGSALGFAIVLVNGFFGIAYTGYVAEIRYGWTRSSTALILGSFTMLLCIAGWRQFHGWIRQRNFVAASITTFLNLFLTFVFLVTAANVGGRAPEGLLSLVLFGTAVALAYSVWSMWRVR